MNLTLLSKSSYCNICTDILNLASQIQYSLKSSKTKKTKVLNKVKVNRMKTKVKNL